MKISGKRLLNQVLGSWDFEDLRPSRSNSKQNSATKKWSKKLRAILKRDLRNDD
jgi:hypothetical protein